jgi:hypothetical protein
MAINPMISGGRVEFVRKECCGKKCFKRNKNEGKISTC